MPGAVLDFVAGQLGISDPQLGISDPSQVKKYTERANTRFGHQREIRRACGLRDFAEAEADLADWVAARSWTSGDGPKAIFLDAVAWLRERRSCCQGCQRSRAWSRGFATTRRTACGPSWRDC